MKKSKKTERIVPLKIGFIGYNSRLTQDGLMKFAKNNKEDVEDVEDVEIINYSQIYIRKTDLDCMKIV